MSSRERRATSDDAQQTKLSVPHATRRTATVPQESKYQPSGASAKSVSRNRFDIGTSISSGQKFASSGDGGLRSQRERQPSNLPRSTASHSNARLEAIAASRPPPTSITASKTKPEIQRPSIGVYEKDHTTNMLRRKTPSIEQYKAYESRGSNTQRRPQTSQSSHFGSSHDLERDTVFGIAPPVSQKPSHTNMSTSTVYSRPRPSELPPSLIPELQALGASEFNQSQMIPAAPVMSSPSSLYSNSPDPWSSRGTTPTSMSSYSPGIVQSHKLNPPARRLNNTSSQQREIKSRHGEPQWTQVPKLPAVQEAAMPASAGSTNKNPVTPKATIENLKKKKTPPPAPTPPPRKSSVKFNPPRAGEPESNVTQEIVDTKHIAAYENPPDSPLRERNARTIEYIGQSLEDSSTRVDTKTQELLPAPPLLYPRRGETSAAGLRAFPTSNDDPGQFSDRSKRGRGSKQLPASHYPQQSDNAKVVQPADPVEGQSAPRAPPANISRVRLVRENQAIATQTTAGTPSRGKRVPSTGASDSEKDTKSISRSGFSKISTFFSRRARSDSTEAIKDNVARSARKGPMAGTGHEGYRKHTFRSRKVSSESATSGDGRSVSQAKVIPRPLTTRKDSGSSHRNSRNSKEDPAAERFVAQRLEPVVILGGGGYRNRPERDAPTPWRTSDGDLSPDRTGYEARVHQASEALSAELNRNSASVQTTTIMNDTLSSRAQANNTDLATRTTTEPSPATRRSFNRAQVSGGANNTIRIPTPIKTEGLAIVPASDSYTTSQSSLPYTSTTLPQVENEMHKVDAKYLKKPSKKGRSLKWNFFHRGASSDKDTKVPEPQARKVVEMPVMITSKPNPRSVPYYAVMDSETDIDHPETLVDFLAQVVDSPSLDQFRDSDQHDLESYRRHENSVLLPSFPPMRTDFDVQARPASPKVHLHHEARSRENNQSSSYARPQRLAQVGRIPRVISRKDYHHVPPVESYSRPFSRGRIEGVPALGVNSSSAEMDRPVLGIQTDVLPSRPFGGYDSAKPASAPARALTLQDNGGVPTEQEFLTFASSHGSQVSISTDSEGIISIAAPHNIFPVHHHGEEEVWKEYDELIDRVLSPAEERKAQSLGTASLTATDRALGGRRKAQPGNVGMRIVSAPTINPSVVEPTPWQALARRSGRPNEDIRLRRSRIVSALHSSISPTSPFSLADLVSEYEERNRISAQLSRRTSEAIKAETAHLSPLTYGNPPDFPPFLPNHHQSTILLDVAERDHEGPAAQSELHFAALMTSKWLSFGRVLFSPGHQEVETLPQQHILVIDGLRNSDWSFYCALTYPSAIIHDLRESDLPPNVQRAQGNEPGRAPPNYRRVEQSSLAERFPFSTSFFTVVVLRFPPAMSDAILKLMVSECKRVLMPGGHLEFMVMDIDMVNMGPHTRRAVKDLKVRMTQADPEVSLKPASDNIQNVLGRKGFEGLNRCVLGIPVAGKVAGSIDSSSSSRSSNGSYTQTAADSAGAPAAGAHGGNTKRHHRHNTNFSLSDLIADHSPTSDEKITKMVAKVGRYWFLRSFEAAVLPDGDLKKSIWADKMVLHECKSRGSGFKLLIAYAQKPVENRRRTVSEPSLPTLATAGTPAMKRMR